MAIASCRSTALISRLFANGFIAVNLLWIPATGLAAAEPSTESFSFVSDEATVPMQGRSASLRTNTTMTVVKNQNTSRKTVFGLNTKSKKPASVAAKPQAEPKQRKGLFSSWGSGGSKLGFFKKGDKKGDAKPNASLLAKQKGTSISIANVKPTSELSNSRFNSRTTIKDTNVVPAAYNSTPQRGGLLQTRSTNANRPTLFGKLSKRSQPQPRRTQQQPTQKQRIQQQTQQQQPSQNQISRKEIPQKQAPKQDAAIAALESRRNSTKSTPNPLDKMFQRRGTRNSGSQKSGPQNSGFRNSSRQTASNQIGKPKQATNQSPKTRNFSNYQLTKPTPTRKPTAPSPVVRKPVDSNSIISQLNSPMNARPQRSPGLALRQPMPLGQSTSPRAIQARGPKQGLARTPMARRSLAATPLIRTPKKVQLQNKQQRKNRLQNTPIAIASDQADTQPAPVTSTQQHVSKLIVEIHEKAETAETADEYTFIVASCRRALAVEPKGELADYAKTLAAWALNRRGQLRADTGDDQHAMLDFEDALKFDSNQWRALHNRAVLRAQTGEFERAFDDFNRCTELNPRFAKAYSNRGALFVQAGDLLAALQDYRRAIQLDPDLAVAHKGRGRVCHMLGSLDESLYHFDAAMLLAPGDAHVVASRADLLADTGRYSDAATEYRRAIEMDDSLAHALRSAAWLLATCPEESIRAPTDALQFALKAIDLDRHENIISLDTLAAAQANSGDYAAAIATMNRVLAIAPEKEISTYQYRLELYTDSQPFRIQPVPAVQAASYTE